MICKGCNGDCPVCQVYDRSLREEAKRRAEAVLRFVARRWPSDGEIAVLIRKATKARGLSVSLADYLRTLARRHEMIARALRLAARAADGEDVNALTEVPIDRDERAAREDGLTQATVDVEALAIKMFDMDLPETIEALRALLVGHHIKIEDRYVTAADAHRAASGAAGGEELSDR